MAAGCIPLAETITRVSDFVNTYDASVNKKHICIFLFTAFSKITHNMHGSV